MFKQIEKQRHRERQSDRQRQRQTDNLTQIHLHTMFIYNLYADTA